MASSRRNTRGASSTNMKKEDSFTRSNRGSNTPEQYADSDDNESRTTSSRPKRSSKATSVKPRSATAKASAGKEESEAESGPDDKDEDTVAKDADDDPEEIEGETDEAGERKVTKDGDLLGGRQYKCRSFKLPTRGNRVYMLGMDPARVLGFRDSYLFFLRNPQLVRVSTTIEERTWLIENGMLMSNFKSKVIAVVTARSVFKLFGYRIIKGGRSRVDDYFEADAPEDDTMDDEEEEDRQVDTNGSVTPAGSSGATMETLVPTPAKRKHTLALAEESTRQVTDLNWMYESAMAVRSLNSQLKDLRKENPKFLDPHTNIEQVPVLSQPNQCEVKPSPEPASRDPAVVPTSTVLCIPRSIGPLVDANVKVEIKGSFPPPPSVDDPNVWAVIPEDIRKALDMAENAKPKTEDNEDLTKYPISILDGQFQAAYPVHQVRFQQPYRVILPQSMAPQAHYLHQLWSAQPRHEGPLMEQPLHSSQTQPLHNPALQPQQFNMQQQPAPQIMQISPQQYRPPHQQFSHQKQASPAPMRHDNIKAFICNAVLRSGLGLCQRPVHTQGELCPNHKYLARIQAQNEAKESASKAPQAADPIVNTCGECQLASAPASAIPKDKPLPCSTSHSNECKTCAKIFHPLCLQLDTPRIVSAIASYPWQCNDCKLCVVCQDAGDEASLLICDDCDRGWHMSCCDPAIKHVPQGQWLCSFCSQCHSCRGTEGLASSYHHAVAKASPANQYPTYICTYCSKCFENFNKDRFCPVCLKTYRDHGSQSDGDGDDNDMVCCDDCNRWVHMECDGQLTPAKVEEMGEDESLKYTCPLCVVKTVPLRSAVMPVGVDSAAALLSLQGHGPPQAKICGTLAGTTSVRGLAVHKGKKLGVPEVLGSGVEYDRKIVASLVAKKAARKRGRPPLAANQTKNQNQKQNQRRASIASSTSSSLSSLSESTDS